METNKQDQRTTEAGFLFKQLLKMKRREMKPGQRKRSQTVKGTGVWLYPWAQEKEYERYLFSLMDVYSKQAIPPLRRNLPRWVEEQRLDSEEEKQDQFENEFDILIDELEQTQFNMFDENGTGVFDNKGNFFSNASINTALLAIAFSISNQNKKQWKKFTTKALGVPFNPAEPWLENALSVWVRANYRLIRSLTDEYIKNLNRIVYDGVTDGQPWDAIMKDIMKMDKNITKNRATLLARDQVGKLNGRLAKRRQQEVGLELYMWLTANDERVRGRPGGRYPNAKPTHWAMHRKIMRWDDDTVYADTLEDAQEGNWKSRSAAGMFVGIPGAAILCRCVPIPQFTDQIQEIDKELEQEVS